MFPTKNMYDYMSEMNRLFPRTTENDSFQSPNQSFINNSSPFRQSTPVNRSSSSADSISPEMYPDPNHWIEDQPFTVRRQRPIVGRKIFDNVERPTTHEQYEPRVDPKPQHIWPIDDQLFATKTQQNQPQNYYELFPTENRGHNFQTFAQISPISFQSPPTPMSISPTYSSTISNISPTSKRISLPRVPTSPFRLPTAFPVARYSNMKPAKLCTFCRKNGETPLVYMNHVVKEKVGTQNIVTCPILRSHVCSTCGASGDNAHTITYCPVLRSTNNGQPLQSTTITLKNTRIKSNGRRRY